MLLPLNDFKANYVRMCVHCFWDILSRLSHARPLGKPVQAFLCRTVQGLKFTFDMFAPSGDTSNSFKGCSPQLDGFKRCSYGRDFGVDGDSGIC